ncbi:hypothetical protein D0962_04120 [Leptolyngbyaceae cyanobacterium CCMR0082]|uniref:SF3 helicase domain-containing protein n=1 Tax=Adonisia turfae CCMR0082 TaxID=2304604 RepID=A0A6M0S0P6_9CYAN|nr:phage/plasmid primase, P4 family [Adonisia turfae]NEZ61966.1 hypothetical protein [Adonisia turfae CCMR0082]
MSNPVDNILKTREILAKRGQLDPTKPEQIQPIWSDRYIDVAISYGVEKLTRPEASERLGFKALDEGIWFPFDDDGYGQLKHDTVTDPKYINPKKEKCSPAAWSPTGNIADCSVVTEGWCDAFIASQLGKANVAAVAGVPHICSVMPAGGGQTIVFDRDGWTNAGVIQNLIKGGCHLKGKIQLIPPECGEKAGFEEYFKTGKTAKDFHALLADAATPPEFLVRWLNFLLKWEVELPKNIKSLDQLYQKVFELAYLCDRDGASLALKVTTFIKTHSKKWLGKAHTAPAIQKFKKEAERPYRENEAKTQLEKRKEAAKVSLAVGSWELKGCLEGALGYDEKGEIKLAPAGKIAQLLETHWGPHLKYRLDFASFYVYGRGADGQWERVSDCEVKELIQRELDIAGACGEYSAALIESVAKLLRQRVAIRHWPTELSLIPFENGVLRLLDNTLLPHSPEYGFTWQLPYDFQPGATCDPIIDWMRWAVNEDETVVQLIRACLKAMILGRTDFQKYLEVIGPGGTGKGTLIRLIQALLGRSNTVSTSFSRIANSRFETSRFMGKKLVIFPDSDYNPAAVDTLKIMTGGDYIPWERKGENADYADGFTLGGMVVVATNTEVKASDNTNALSRRRVPIYFNRVVPDGERRSLLEFGPDGLLRGEFSEYLPGLFNWVLAMPDERMEAYIRNPRQYVGAMAEFQAQALLNTDNLAQWVDDRVVVDTGSWTKVGDKNGDRFSCLYPNYIDYCESANVKPLSLSKFSGALENLMQEQLGIDGVERKRGRAQGAGFTGIRLVGVDSSGKSDDFDSPQTVSNALRGTHNQNEDALLSPSDIQRLNRLHKEDKSTFDRELARLSEPQRHFFRFKRIPDNGRHPVNAI